MSTSDLGQPDRTVIDLHSTTAAVRAVETAVRVLDTHREVMSTAAKEMQADVKEMRDRMKSLEGTLATLPTKDWLGGVIFKAVGALAAVVAIIGTIIGGLVALIHYSH